MRKTLFSKSEDLDICTHVMNWTARDPISLKEHIQQFQIKGKKPSQVYNRWKTLLKTSQRAKNANARFKALKKGAEFHPERMKSKITEPVGLEKTALRFKEHHDNLNEGKNVKKEIIEEFHNMKGLFGKAPSGIEIENMKYDKNTGIFTAEKIVISFFFIICFSFWYYL